MAETQLHPSAQTASPLLLTQEQISAWLAVLDSVSSQGLLQSPVLRVMTDSRQLQAGDLFIALQGEKFDGAAFIEEVIQKGAVAVVAPRSAAQQVAGLGCCAWLVDDTRAALAALAHGWRMQFDLALIAVTGSNGKTTVTQMLASILRAAYGEAAWATQGNFNNDIGVPLTLLGLRAKHRAAAIEMGMNHPGEIARLAQMAAPTVALVNNAQREHQEFMHSVEAVAQENGAVISALPPQGVAVFPANDAHTAVWHDMAQGHAKACFAFGPQTGASADAPPQVWAEHVHWHEGHWQLTLCLASHWQAVPERGQRVAVALHIAGRHNVGNALAAATAALAAGVPLSAVVQGLAAFEAVAGRSRTLWVQLGSHHVTLVDDSYNANPDSVRAAIEVLAELPAPRLLVLGDMGEVGDQGPAFHAEVGAYARQREVQLLTHGALCAHAARAHGQAQHCETFEDVQQAFGQALQRCASVVVKGSRFMRMERLLSGLQTVAPEHNVEKLNVA